MQFKKRIDLATDTLIKLYRYKNLSQKNKLKLYKSLILSKLIYPTVPLNTLSETQMLKLQVVQNKSLRFITNTSLRDRVTAKSLHERLNILPINQTIHNQAKNTWEHFQQAPPQKYQKICDETPAILTPIPHTTQQQIKS